VRFGGGRGTLLMEVEMFILSVILNDEKKYIGYAGINYFTEHKDNAKPLKLKDIYSEISFLNVAYPHITVYHIEKID
jgi:hypothetical protein